MLSVLLRNLRCALRQRAPRGTSLYLTPAEVDAVSALLVDAGEQADCLERHAVPVAARAPLPADVVDLTQRRAARAAGAPSAAGPTGGDAA